MTECCRASAETARKRAAEIIMQDCRDNWGVFSVRPCVHSELAQAVLEDRPARPFSGHQ